MDDNGSSRKLRDILAISLLLSLPVLWVILFVPRLFPTEPADTVALSTVAGSVKSGAVSTIVVSGDDLTVVLIDGRRVTSRKESDVGLTQTLRAMGVTDQQLARVDLRVDQSSGFDWLGSFIWILPLIGVLVLILVFSRQSPQAGPGDQTLSFLKSRARKIVSDRPRVRFEDVAGVDEAKEELQEIVEFLRSPARFLALGARAPKGVLLVGPPGTGKTLLARAVAGEAGVPFFSIGGSEFVEMFVGVGASRVRDLFEQAKRSAPCIVFIDEIDAVGRQRGIGLGGGHDEREQTLNQILVEMDGFDKQANLVIIAATNRPDVLDPALLRPGRFDRHISLDSPDVTGRLAIFRIHARGKPLAADVDFERLARQTSGLSGADIENVVNEAAILAARRAKMRIDDSDLEEAIDRVMAGPARRSRLLTPQEKAITAYHEVGHALVAHLLPNLDPVHKVTIVARGASGGHTRLLLTNDRHLWTRSHLGETLAFALGGLAAEEVVFGEATTGPGSDLQHATELAHKMVCEYGMSEVVGPVVLGGHPALARYPQDHAYSDFTAREIDEEIRKLIEVARLRARDLLVRYRERLDAVARLLLTRETLQGDELTGVLDGKVTLPSPAADDEPAPHPPGVRPIRPKPTLLPPWQLPPTKSA
ncbi:MAG: ATP-dependent zinc metalloprotease FtsH [Chloroflexi bacterium]|nr:ATP-dependent zinc metalloprotease FtsH [Chloroflexota bacterium]